MAFSEYPSRREEVLKKQKAGQPSGGRMQEVRSGHFKRLERILTATGRHYGF